MFDHYFFLEALYFLLRHLHFLLTTRSGASRGGARGGGAYGGGGARRWRAGADHLYTRG